MRRVLLPAAVLALLLVIALLLTSALSRPQVAQVGADARVEQVDPSAYPEITLYVSVTDESGNPRDGLTRDDFALTEDGVPVEVANFGGAGTGPVSSVLVVDRSGSMEEERKIDGAREAATAFVELLRPGDQAALIAFNDEADLVQPFTGRQDELVEAINYIQTDSGTALYDAVIAGVELLRDQPGRRLLLVLSDGQDCSVPFDACPDEVGSRNSLEEAIAYAQAAGQPVAVVGLGNRSTSGVEGIDEAVLQRIADETGGRYFYAPEAGTLAGLYTELAGSVQREYRLTYVSPRPSYDGMRRDIEVQVGGTVASAGYTERHLINVVSNPLVGVVLLVPLAGLLVLPGVLRARRGRGQVGAPSAPMPVAAAAPPATAAAFASPAALIEPIPPSAEGRRCASCDAPLRPTARFCARCGATQPDPVATIVERRTFCDMCGQPLMPGAKFCTSCGEAVLKRG